MIFCRPLCGANANLPTMSKILTAYVLLFLSAFTLCQSVKAETKATTQQFMVFADGSVMNYSTTKYLSVEEAILYLSWVDENNEPKTSLQAIAQGGGSSEELQELLIAGEDQNDINHMLPNIDLGYMSHDSWSVAYKLKNTSEKYAITITDYRINLYAMHYNGSGHTAINGNVDVLLTPGYWDGSTHSMSQTTVTLEGSNQTGEAGVSHGWWKTHLQQSFTLNPGEEIYIFATIMAPEHNDHSDGHLFIGLEGFQLAGSAYTAVPEPATTALGLLSLVSLAAYRRRK